MTTFAPFTTNCAQTNVRKTFGFSLVRCRERVLFRPTRWFRQKNRQNFVSRGRKWLRRGGDFALFSFRQKNQRRFRSLPGKNLPRNLCYPLPFFLRRALRQGGAQALPRRRTRGSRNGGRSPRARARNACNLIQRKKIFAQAIPPCKIRPAPKQAYLRFFRQANRTDTDKNGRRGNAFPPAATTKRTLGFRKWRA